MYKIALISNNKPHVWFSEYCIDIFLFNVTLFLIIYAILFSNVHPVNVSPTELAWLKLFLVAAPIIMLTSGSRARFTYLVPIGPRKISPTPLTL